MKVHDFWFYVFAFLCGGNWREEDGYTSIAVYLSAFYKSLFSPKRKVLSHQSTDNEKSVTAIQTSLPFNRYSPKLMTNITQETPFPNPVGLYRSAMNLFEQQIQMPFQGIKVLHTEIITCLIIVLILISIIRLLVSLKRYGDRTEKIMLEKVDKSLQELGETMIKVSDNITSATYHFLREQITRCDEKYSVLLSTLSKALQFQRLRNEEREARSCYLIMKFRSARLLQYGQINAYLESLMDHISKEHSDLIVMQKNLNCVKRFTDGITTQFSESKAHSQRLILEILQSIQRNALYEEDSIKSSDELSNMVSILEPIIHKKINTFAQMGNFNGLYFSNNLVIPSPIQIFRSRNSDTSSLLVSTLKNSKTVTNKNRDKIFKAMTSCSPNQLLFGKLYPKRGLLKSLYANYSNNCGEDNGFSSSSSCDGASAESKNSLK